MTPNNYFLGIALQRIMYIAILIMYYNSGGYQMQEQIKNRGISLFLGQSKQ